MFFIRIDVLDPFDFLFLDLVLKIKFSKKGWVDAMIPKMPMKHYAAFLQRQAYPVMQSVRIKKIFNMFFR